MTVSHHRFPPLEWRKEPGLLLTSRTQRRGALESSGGKCSSCGLDANGEFHADHRHPLWLVDRDNFPENLKFWRIENIALVCLPCHRAKTAREAGAKAKINRIIRNNGVCIICKKPVRADCETVGYCQAHRNHSPEFTSIIAKRKPTNSKSKWQNMTEAQREDQRSRNNLATKAWRMRNAEYKREINRKWISENKSRKAAINAKSRDKRRATPLGSINHRMATAIRQSLKLGKVGRGWETLVGYTVIELRNHLEKLFLPGMSWESFLRGEIHIDHIRPISSFSYSSTDDDDFMECWALKNLQPLWRADNQRKSNRFTPEPLPRRPRKKIPSRPMRRPEKIFKPRQAKQL